MHLRKRLATLAATTTLAGLATLGLTMPAQATGQQATAVQHPTVDKCAQNDTWQDTYNNFYLNASGWGGSGTHVIEWNGGGQGNEHWCLERAAEGGWYFHPSYNLDLCMDVPGGNYSDGTGIVIWNCNGRPNQRFSVTSSGNGDYIAPQASGHFALDGNGYGQQITLGWNYFDGGSTSWH